jgi:hypothetical protein
MKTGPKRGLFRIVTEFDLTVHGIINGVFDLAIILLDVTRDLILFGLCFTGGVTRRMINRTTDFSADFLNAAFDCVFIHKRTFPFRVVVSVPILAAERSNTHPAIYGEI